MKNIFKDLYLSFLNLKISKKVIIVFLTLVYITLILGVTIKVDKEVMTPGSINETVNSKNEEKAYSVIEINTDNASGDINTVGVYAHIRVSFFQYLIAGISNSLKIDDYDPLTDLSEEEEYERGKIHKNFSIDHALIVAYNKAAEIDPTIKLDYKFNGLIVSVVSKDSKSNLRVGDIIEKVNGDSFSNLEEFRVLSGAIIDEDFKLTVLRDDISTVIDSNKYKGEENEFKLGVEVTESYDINSDNSNPTFKINTELRSIGSSGGAMMALSIFNALLIDDITNGLKIVGTGTISTSGIVGPIGGIEQKIITAKINNADIFFVPSFHYNEAKKVYDEIDAKFDLVSVETIDEIIKYLEDNA